MLLYQWLMFAWACVETGKDVAAWPVSPGRRLAIIVQGVLLLFVLLLLLRGWWT